VRGQRAVFAPAPGRRPVNAGAGAAGTACAVCGAALQSSCRPCACNAALVLIGGAHGKILQGQLHLQGVPAD
jgi:hypothetical protein